MKDKVEDTRNLADHPVESKLYDLIAANNLSFGKVTATRYSAIEGAKVCEDVAVGFAVWWTNLTENDCVILGFTKSTTYVDLYNFYVQNILDHE